VKEDWGLLMIVLSNTHVHKGVEIQSKEPNA